MKLEWQAVKGGLLGKKPVNPFITAVGTACVWRILHVNNEAAYGGDAYMIFMCPDLDVELGDHMAWSQFKQVMPLEIVYYRVVDRAMKIAQAMEDGIDALMGMIPEPEEEEEEYEEEEGEEDDEDEEEYEEEDDEQPF